MTGERPIDSSPQQHCKERPVRSGALGTLGLAMRAGQVVSGEYMTERSIREGRARLVVIAADASGGTRKKFTDSCTYYQVPIVITADKESLGRSLGKKERASAAVLDEGFASSIRKNITGEVQ